MSRDVDQGHHGHLRVSEPRRHGDVQAGDVVRLVEQVPHVHDDVGHPRDAVQDGHGHEDAGQFLVFADGRGARDPPRDVRLVLRAYRNRVGGRPCEPVHHVVQHRYVVARPEERPVVAAGRLVRDGLHASVLPQKLEYPHVGEEDEQEDGDEDEREAERVVVAVEAVLERALRLGRDELVGAESEDGREGEHKRDAPADQHQRQTHEAPELARVEPANEARSVTYAVHGLPRPEEGLRTGQAQASNLAGRAHCFQCVRCSGERQGPWSLACVKTEKVGHCKQTQGKFLETNTWLL